MAMKGSNTTDLDRVPSFLKELRGLSDQVEAIYLSDKSDTDKQAQIHLLIGEAV